jgi:DNA-binding transcriptional LysR family regulator
LGGSDLLLSLIAPPLLRRMLAQSPGATVRFDAWSDTALHDTGRGAVDIVFIAGPAAPLLRSESMFGDGYECLL